MRPKRTVGERLVDTLVYPVINNVGVFVISVGATYLTEHGDKFGKDGSKAREMGMWFKARGVNLKNFLQEKFSMTAKTADMTKMVFFSFADGTVVAPFVKLLEDRREKMAKGIDKALGTKPADESVYKVEPKQTWGSVIKGRLATSLIVAPTAFAFQEIKPGGKSINDHMFETGSGKLATWFEKKTTVAKRFPKLDVPYLSKTIVFEAVYTTICTAGLYVISRAIAKRRKEHKEAIEEYRQTHARVIKPNADAQETAAITVDTAETPVPQVSQASQVARLAETPQTQGLNA